MKKLEAGKTITIVKSTEEAVSYLKSASGNILLTTGVKTLEKYVCEAKLKDRVIARILPSKESMDIAYSLDISPRNIVALEGPFSKEFNKELIRKYDIKVLVTKNSGERGGFNEKLEAAKE